MTTSNRPTPADVAEAWRNGQRAQAVDDLCRLDRDDALEACERIVNQLMPRPAPVVGLAEQLAQQLLQMHRLSTSHLLRLDSRAARREADRG